MNKEQKKRMKESNKQAENKPCTIHGVRVRFYLCDFDEDFWVEMPCRINIGDSFYIDDFISADDEKRLKKETIEYLYNGNILECKSFIFGRDNKGIYQQCYLTDGF